MSLPAPSDEARRLEAVRRLALLDTPAEDRFDRITRLAGRVLGAPWALLTLVDQDRDWVKSAHGPWPREFPRAQSFAAWTILGSGPTVIPDLRLDPRFMDYPLAAMTSPIRSYAGHPIRGRKGLAVGALSVFGVEPRSLEGWELEALADLAAQAEAELRISRLSWVQQELIAESDLLKRQGMVDPLTKAWSRTAILELLARETAHAARLRSPLAAALVQVDASCDSQALIQVGGRLRRELRSYDAVGRVGDGEFLALFPGAELAEAAAAVERTRGAVESGDCTLSAGVASWIAGRESAAGLFERAHVALGGARREGANRIRMAPQVLGLSPGLKLNS